MLENFDPVYTEDNLVSQVIDTNFFKFAAYFNSFEERKPLLSVFPSFLSFVLEVKVISDNNSKQADKYCAIDLQDLPLVLFFSRTSWQRARGGFWLENLKSDKHLIVFILLLMTLGCFVNQFNISAYLYPIGPITYGKFATIYTDYSWYADATVETSLSCH